jgi:hypothetical protein
MKKKRLFLSCRAKALRRQVGLAALVVVRSARINPNQPHPAKKPTEKNLSRQSGPSFCIFNFSFPCLYSPAI